MHFSVNLDQFMHYYILHQKDVIILFNATNLLQGSYFSEFSDLILKSTWADYIGRTYKNNKYVKKVIAYVWHICIKPAKETSPKTEDWMIFHCHVKKKLKVKSSNLFLNFLNHFFLLYIKKNVAIMFYNCLHLSLEIFGLFGGTTKYWQYYILYTKLSFWILLSKILQVWILNQFWILAQFYTKVVILLKMLPKLLTFLVRQDLHTISNGLLVLCTFSTLLMCLLHSRYVNVIDSIIKNIFTSQQIVYYKSKTGYNPREIGLI